MILIARNEEKQSADCNPDARRRRQAREQLLKRAGSGSGGLGPTWRSAGVERVSIPMAGVADSLIVSIAAAGLLVEAVRQRSGDREPPNCGDGTVRLRDHRGRTRR
jgi:tRNA(Leu) C34 or U34 (ribose-2'-O)-methylase TrmL